MNQRGSGIDWLLFVLLGFFWGSSYLFIKIGVDAGLAPFTLVATRLLFGFLLLARWWLIAREALPRRIGMYGHLLVMAILSVALPFSLITWAEQSVDSTLAATLNASVPLFVIPIAAFVLIDEKITTNKVIGVVVGFIGVAILVGFDPGVLAGTDVLAAAGAHRLIHLVCGRWRVRAALRARLAPDDPGGDAGRLRAGHHRDHGVHLRIADQLPGALRCAPGRGLAWAAGVGCCVPRLLPAAGPMGRDADLPGGLPAAGVRDRAGGAGAGRAGRRAADFGTLLVIAGIALVNLRGRWLPLLGRRPAAPVEAGGTGKPAESPPP